MGNDTRPVILADLTGIHERLDRLVEAQGQGTAETVGLKVEVRGCRTEIARTRTVLFGREGNGGSPGVLREMDATKGRVATLEKTRRRQVKGFWVCAVAVVSLAVKQTWEWVWG